MRRMIPVLCEGETLAATLDDAAGVTGLLIVSGGNEVRAGAHRGMALLAARLAADGIPVLRYDRRGIGDSTGENHGYASAAPDLAAALAAFRHAMPAMRRVIGFGNCDAATTLAIHGRAVGLDAVILANPWVVPTQDDLPPAAAIRARYRDRLRDPQAWRRLVGGKVDIVRLIRGLARLAQPQSQGNLARSVLAGIAAWGADATVILATGDATAIAFADAARDAPIAPVRIDTASHSFAHAADRSALEAAIRAALA